jgi:hypothetical protein
MNELQMYHRLFLYIPEDPQFVLRLRVCPDIEQAHGRRDPTAVISFPTADHLLLCLRELGVTGYSQWVGEVGGVPVSSYIECDPEKIVASLDRQPLSRVAHVTLIAPSTPISDMKRRVTSLRGKAAESLCIEEPV